MAISSSGSVSQDLVSGCLCVHVLESTRDLGEGHRKVLSSRMRQPWVFGRFSCINIEWSNNNKRKPSHWWCYRSQWVTHQPLCLISLQRTAWMVMEIPHHTCLYWEKQIIPLAVKVIRFLDILIAMGKIGRGREEGKSCHVTMALPYSQVCFVFLLSHSSAIAWEPRTAEANFLVKHVNGTLSPTRCRREGRLLRRPLYFMGWDGQFLLALPVCSVVANTPDWEGGAGSRICGICVIVLFK